MPKIPTFITEARPTAEVGGVISGIQVPVTAPFTGAQSALTDYYIQEKKKEAAVKTLDYKNQYWNDSEDGTEGLFSIKNKHENNPNTTDAINGMKLDGKNYEIYLNNKLQGESDYLKQSVLAEFKADLNRMSISVQEKSQDALDKKQGMLAKNIISTEIAVSGDNPALLATSKIKIEKSLEDLFPNNQIKKQQYIEEGKTALDELVATKQVMSSPTQAKLDLQNPNIYTNLDATKRVTLIKQAEEGSYKIKSSQLLDATIPTNLTDLKQLVQQESTIKNKTFNGNKDLQNLYNSFNEVEKVKFEADFNSRVRDVRNDVLLNQAAQLNATKSKAISEVSATVDDVLAQRKTNQEIDSDRNLSPEIKNQYKLINDKMANNKFLNQSNFDTNSKITEMILDGTIKSPADKFKIGKEIESKSILERAGEGINKTDVLRYQEIFSQKSDTTYIKNQKEFFNFINKNVNLIKGGDKVSSVDPSTNDRINRFKDEMYFKFQQGIKDGKSSSSLLNESNFFIKNEDYIGNNISSYVPSTSDILKSINDSVSKAKTNANNINPPPARLQDETPSQYLKSDRYLNWKKSQGK
jgi:hypothetical protein